MILVNDKFKFPIANFSKIEWKIYSIKAEKTYISSFSGVFNNLVTLTLPKCGLLDFGGKFPVLRYLDLSLNSLAVFEGTYPCLKELNLTNNKLIAIRGNYPKVTKVRLGSNFLSSFCLRSSVLTGFLKLKTLVVFKNKLEEFEGDFPNLGFLDVERNCNLKLIKGKYPKLQTLLAGFNGLEKFKGRFSKLNILILESNKISSFEGHFKSLEVLDLGGNPKLHFLLPELPSIKEVVLRDTGVVFVASNVKDKVYGKNVEERLHSVGVEKLIWELLPLPIAEETAEHITC